MLHLQIDNGMKITNIFSGNGKVEKVKTMLGSLNLELLETIQLLKISDYKTLDMISMLHA